MNRGMLEVRQVDGFIQASEYDLIVLCVIGLIEQIYEV